MEYLVAISNDDEYIYVCTYRHTHIYIQIRYPQKKIIPKCIWCASSFIKCYVPRINLYNLLCN
jgi:hypothetical protein